VTIRPAQPEVLELLADDRAGLVELAEPPPLVQELAQRLGDPFDGGDADDSPARRVADLATSFAWSSTSVCATSPGETMLKTSRRGSGVERAIPL